MGRFQVTVVLVVGSCLSAFANPVPVKITDLKAGRTGYYAAEARIPSFASAQPVPRLATSTVGAAMRTGYAEFIDDSRRMMADPELRRLWASNGGRPPGKYFYSSEAVVSISQTNLVSAMIETHTYTGGAHPNSFLRPHNFALVGGQAQRLSLDTMLKPEAEEKLLAEVVSPALKAIQISRGVEEATGAIDPQMAERWLITPAGMSWIFEPYAVGSYAEGSYTVKVAWDRLLPYLSATGASIAGMANPRLKPVLDAPGLIGSTWELISFEYSDDTIIVVDDPSRYTITLDASGTFAMRVDVNRGRGRYSLSGPSLSFQPGPLTRAAPGPGSHHDRFLRDLPHVATYVLREHKLYLNLKMDGGNLVFRRKS